MTNTAAVALRIDTSSFFPDTRGFAATRFSEEARASSTHYGAVSTTTGLLTKRYASFQFGYTSEGFYFAARTSLPEEPQQLVSDDAVTLSLLPPGARDTMAVYVLILAIGFSGWVSYARTVRGAVMVVSAVAAEVEELS